tara:strand:+ start:15893 stop:16075 length:183 start_codon:yes stop_codon:yes gene_type:complete
MENIKTNSVEMQLELIDKELIIQVLIKEIRELREDNFNKGINLQRLKGELNKLSPGTTYT